VRFLVQSLVVLGTWLSTLVLMTLLFEPIPTVAVFGPAAQTIAALEGSDTRILDAGSGYVIVRGESEGFVRELYRKGALLVLPARDGCLGPRRT
jgi:hypothetical protein